MSASPRVALVCSTYPPVLGGVETYNQRVAHALARAGARVTVATRFVSGRPADGMRGLLTRTEPAQRYREDGGPDVRVLTAEPAGLLRPVYRLHFRPVTVGAAVALLARAYRRALTDALDGADVVHYSGTGRELLGFAALAEARRRGARFVVTPHLHAGSWGDGPLDARLYRRADGVLAATHVERDHLASLGVAPNRVHVVGHGVNVTGRGDGARFRAAHGLGDAPVVLFLARKTAYKGYERLLAAAPHVWDRAPETRFVLAGPPVDPAGPAHAATLADPRVVDLGALSDAEREDAYAAATVFCVPSEAEAFGLVYLEAWRYGVPVVALRIPTLTELIDGTGGLLADDTPAALTGALVRLLTDGALRARLGAAGAARAATATWADAAGRLLHVYRGAEPAAPARVPAPHA